VPNPHRLMGKDCTGGNSWAHNSDMSFRVHHYVGSLKAFRRPGFDSRGMEKFRERNNQKGLVVDNVALMQKSLWVADFVALVGEDKAFSLTQKLRIDAELEMERLIMVVDVSDVHT